MLYLCCVQAHVEEATGQCWVSSLIGLLLFFDINSLIWAQPYTRRSVNKCGEGMPLSIFPVLRLQVPVIRPGFYMGSEDPNACSERFAPMQPSPYPLLSYFYHKFLSYMCKCLYACVYLHLHIY